MNNDHVPRPAFIHSKLDEYGLTPIQFRIFCAIARSGTCFVAADTLAERCRVHRNSIWPAIRFLLGRKMIQATHRSGQTTIYTPSPMANWLPNLAQRERQVTQHKRSATPQHKRSATHLAQRERHKVNPSEVNPFREGSKWKDGWKGVYTAIDNP